MIEQAIRERADDLAETLKAIRSRLGGGQPLDLARLAIDLDKPASRMQGHAAKLNGRGKAQK